MKKISAIVLALVLVLAVASASAMIYCAPVSGTAGVHDVYADDATTLLIADQKCTWKVIDTTYATTAVVPGGVMNPGKHSTQTKTTVSKCQYCGDTKTETVAVYTKCSSFISNGVSSTQYMTPVFYNDYSHKAGETTSEQLCVVCGQIKEVVKNVYVAHTFTADKCVCGYTRYYKKATKVSMMDSLIKQVNTLAKKGANVTVAGADALSNLGAYDQIAAVLAMAGIYEGDLTDEAQAAVNALSDEDYDAIASLVKTNTIHFSAIDGNHKNNASYTGSTQEVQAKEYDACYIDLDADGAVTRMYFYQRHDQYGWELMFTANMTAKKKLNVEINYDLVKIEKKTWQEKFDLDEYLMAVAQIDDAAFTGKKWDIAYSKYVLNAAGVPELHWFNEDGTVESDYNYLVLKTKAPTIYPNVTVATDADLQAIAAGTTVPTVTTYVKQPVEVVYENALAGKATIRCGAGTEYGKTAYVKSGKAITTIGEVVVGSGNNATTWYVLDDNWSFICSTLAN